MIEIRLINSKEEVIENIKSFHGLTFKSENSILNEKAKEEYVSRIGDARNIVRSKINGEYFFTPSKFCGYYRDEEPNTLELHIENKNFDSDGRETTPQIKKYLGKLIEKDDHRWNFLEKEYKKFQEKIYGKSTDYNRKYWDLGEEILLNNIETKAFSTALSSKGGQGGRVRDSDKTEKEIMVKARIGQGPFRESLIQRFTQSCAVSGVKQLEILRASHIKPWSQSNNEERLDTNNGLLLRADLDALFDRGLITFQDNGKVNVSNLLECSKTKDGLKDLRLREVLNSEQQKYLDYHRKEIFKDS